MVLATLAGACGGSPAATAPGATGAMGGTASSPVPSGPTATLAPVPSYAVASPVTSDGAADLSSLVPPDFETGDVPAYQAPAPATKATAKAGPAAQLATGSAGPDGGTITVSKPGDPLDGLAISVPAGTYASTVQFTVSEKPLDTKAVADGYTAASAVVSIDNGGVPATGDPVLVTIPAAIPDGADVVGLYLHPDASLDVLPVVARDAKGATVAAPHFSDIVLALVDWSKIPTTVDSGFRPGTDDWEFPNYGSFVAPGGHCLGQSVTAIWYYDTQRLAGASPLYGLFDNNSADPKTPTFWKDDSDGYRFASTIQVESPAIPTAAAWFRSFKTSPNVYAYAMLRAAIGLSGRPQLMSIADAQGGSRHAIIAYRVTPQRVYVADPNYPGKLRTITWDPATGTLGPYYSGDSAGSIAAGGGVAYTQFAFLPYSAAVSDDRLAARWAQFETNSVGSDVFPKLPLEYVSGQDSQGNDIWTPLPAAVTTDQAQLRVRIAGTPTGSRLGGYLGTKLAAQGTGELKIALKEGANDVGLFEEGAKDGYWEYVDFVRAAVTREPIDINGTWEGTLTFNVITADQAAQDKASAEGCDFSIAEALRDKALPTTIEIVADKDGTGTAKLTIDASAADPQASEASKPTPVSLTLVYRDGEITFDLSQACGGASAACTMTGVPSAGPTADPADDTITGSLAVKGEGFEADAAYTVTRQP